jgi:hypothetical protein
MEHKKFALVLLAPFLLGGCSLAATYAGAETKEEAADDVVTFSKAEMTLYVPSGHQLKIYQLNDSHFGDPAKAYHNGSPEKTRLLIDYDIAVGKPDLIVCGGDNFLGTGTAGAKTFFTMMDKYQIPYVFAWGNHDSEGYVKQSMSSYIVGLNSEYCLYQDGFVDSSFSRYGNYAVKIKNKATKALEGAIFVLDSGLYDYTNGYYEYITAKEIAWYQETVASLQEEYTGEGVVPSLEFQHIQLPEFYDAYEAALNGEDEASWVIDYPTVPYSGSEAVSIQSGGPSINSGFFDEMVSLGSTKGVFCGHMHYMRWQASYQGITFGFGPQTGYANLFPNDSETKHAYLYQVNEDFSFTTEDITQPLDIK